MTEGADVSYIAIFLYIVGATIAVARGRSFNAIKLNQIFGRKQTSALMTGASPVTTK